MTLKSELIIVGLSIYDKKNNNKYSCISDIQELYHFIRRIRQNSQ